MKEFQSHLPFDVGAVVRTPKFSPRAWTLLPTCLEVHWPDSGPLQHGCSCP